MNLSAICAGFACLALLTIPLKTAAQLDSPAANAAIQRNVQAARAERVRKAMFDDNTLEFLAAQLKTEIARSRPDTVSVTVTKRAEEIENWRAKSEPSPSKTAIFEQRKSVFWIRLCHRIKGDPKMSPSVRRRS